MKSLTTQKVPKFGVFQVFSFPIWIEYFTEQISVFVPNMGKYGPKEYPNLDYFQAVLQTSFSENHSGLLQLTFS